MIPRTPTQFLGLTLSIAALTVPPAHAQSAQSNPARFGMLTEFSMGGRILELVFSPDSKQVAASAVDEGGTVWNLSTGREAFKLGGHALEIGGLTYSSDGRTLYSASGGNVKTWQTLNGKNTSSVTVNCDEGDSGNIALLGGGRYLVYCKGLKLVSAQNGRILGEFKGGPATVSSNAFALSSDQKTLLSSIGDADFQLWDVTKMGAMRALKGHTGQGMTAVAFSNDNRTVATGASDNTARLWDSRTGKVLRVLSGHDNTVNELAFSPDGKYLASVSSDRTLKLWTVASGQEVKTLQAGDTYLTHVAWSPNGKFIVTGDSAGDLRVYGLPGSL